MFRYREREYYAEVICPVSAVQGMFSGSSMAEVYAQMEADGWQFLEFTHKTGDFESSGEWVKANEIDENRDNWDDDAWDEWQEILSAYDFASGAWD